MLSDLINPPECRKSRKSRRRKTTETGQIGPKSGDFGDLATVTPATVATDEMPSRAELERICRRAVADYPDIEPERVRRFIEAADDPEWCNERVARHTARRMSEGLIRERGR